MNISRLNMVAVMRNGSRYPISGVRTDGRPRLEPHEIGAAVKAQHRPHKIVIDPRPWLVFAGSDEQAAHWQISNHMALDRWRQVRGIADVEGIDPKDWQLCLIGTWRANIELCDALRVLVKV